MSDDKQPPKPPAPMKKTSAVPLKKETVRVNLEADSATDAPSAPQAPPAPAPTIPLKTAPVASAPAPTASSTIPLKTAPVKPLATPASGGGGSKPLPQATVQLQSTQQLGTPTASTSPTIGTIATTDVDDEEESDTIPNLASILAFVLALGALVLGLMTWMKENTIGDLFS